MTAEVIHLPARTFLEVTETSPHWLIFTPDRQVKGCACGYPADPADFGYGDAVVDHLLEVGKTLNAAR